RLCSSGLADLATNQINHNRISFDIERHSCIRIGIATNENTPIIQATLHSPSGAELTKTSSNPPMLLPNRGPICLDEPGTYQLETSTVPSGAPLKIRIWSAAPTTNTPPSPPK
ncbi:MAG: hypothetical protein FWD57_08515, partial [Polyangiaceae bacterium]|nr:hypothetical protein [Polyangiaceae bacterium]